MRRIRHLLQYGVYLTLKGTVRTVPHHWSRPMGRAAGALVHLLAGGMRRVAMDNLACALPALSPVERGHLARECFRQLGASVFDVLSASRFSPEDLAQRVDVVGWEHYEEAARMGRGVFLMGAHLGCWEIAGYVLGLRAAPVHVVSEQLSNPHFDRELSRLRARFGIQTIDQEGAARRMYRVVASGGRLLIALDQRTRYEDAIAVTFFDRFSLTSPIPAFIALKRGAPVVPAFSYSADGSRYRVELEPAIEPEGSGRKAIAEMTERYLAVIERRIRQRPELWLWMYRRWRPEWDDPATVGSSFALKPGDEDPPDPSD